MSIILGRGEDAKKAIDNSNNTIDFSKIFMKLKAGDSKKVRILSADDYVAYKAHGHYPKGINTQPCVKGVEERCLLCEAANYDGEMVGSIIDTVQNQKGEEVSEYKPMYAKKRVLFAMVDLEEGEVDNDGNPKGELKVFDATSNQADVLIETIDEYGEELNDVAFTFKRTGGGKETTYSLNPIMPKKMKEIQTTFDAWDDEEVETKLFEDALQARTTDEQAKELLKSGFPIEQALDYKVDTTINNSEGEESPNKEAEAKQDTEQETQEDDLPF